MLLGAAVRRLILTVAVTVNVACVANKDSPGGSAGLVTVFDSTADTIVAHVDGQVPLSALRSMTPVMQIAPSADDTLLFAAIGEVEIDRANRVWVFDYYQSKKLYLFDSAGTLLKRIGRQGQGPGEFEWGGGLVTLPDTGAAVWDSQNARISFFDAKGDFRTSWMTPAGFSTNNGLYIDTGGRLYLKRAVTPPREGEILGRMGLVRLGENGAFADSLLPVDLPVPRDIYTAVSPDGRGQSSTPSSFGPNFHWDWHPDSYFVAGHGGLYEIVIERPDSKPVVIRRTAPPVPILPDEREEEKQSITWSMRQTQPSWSWTGGPLPETKAPLTGITVTRDGNIWASVAVPSERIPDDELLPQRDKEQPVRHYRNSRTTYEVFAPDGRFLGRVPMPPRTRMFQADGEYFWAISRDEDDLPLVIRFRMSRPFSNE